MLVVDGELTWMSTATLPRTNASTRAPLSCASCLNPHLPEAESGMPAMRDGDPVGNPPADPQRSAASPTGFWRRTLGREVDETSVISRPYWCVIHSHRAAATFVPTAGPARRSMFRRKVLTYD